MTTENENQSPEESASASTPGPGAQLASAARRGPSTALAVTGIVVGSVLLLGLTFGGGVLTGTLLPDRWPGTDASAGSVTERLHDRMEDLRDLRDDRQDRRDDRRDERPGFGQEDRQPPAEPVPDESAQG